MCENHSLKPCYDEIFIWDKNGKIVYLNDACYRHYGLRPEGFLGKTLQECTENEKLWSPSCVSMTFDEKSPMIQKQKTFLGIDIVTISVPIMDEHGGVEYVLQIVRDGEISERVMELLKRYPWKGNIRELYNVIERGVLTAEERTIEISNLPESFFHVENEKKVGCAVLEQNLSFDEAVEEYEKKVIQEAYAKYGSSRRVAE